MIKQILLSATVATAAIAATSAQAATNLVANGGFDTTTTTSASGNFQIDNGGAIASWSSAGGYNLLFNAANANTAAGNAKGTWSDGTATGGGSEYMWASTASPVGAGGGNFVALDGDVSASGKLSQTITGLTIGQVYNLQFYWGAGQIHSRTGATTEQLQVNFGDSVFTTGVLSNASQSFTGWNLASTNFTATSSSQVLSFLSLGTPTGLPPVALLDGVSLTAAVPEASTWTMMILGFGAIGCAIRRSRTTLAFA